MKTVLLVDDEENTRFFVHFALNGFIPSLHLRYLHDGVQTMRYLEGFGLYSDRKIYPFPDLMLLDLKMPLVDGFEVLEWTRARPALHTLPIVVLSEPSYETDITRALQMGAKAFVTKAVDFTEFEQALKYVVARLLAGSPPPVSTHFAKAA